MYGALKAALFRLDPERAHDLALQALSPVHRSAALQRALRAPPPPPRLAVRALGLAFPAPLGMAAGFDKAGRAYNALLALGFSHVEVGTVTPRPQAGNDRPRLERHPGRDALVNRLGFPNPGREAVARRLAACPGRGILGANAGPNKRTAAEAVGDDLAAVAEALAPHVRYVAVNVSSPNTPGLRALQEPYAVARLVRRVLESLDAAGRRLPVLLKLHPDAPDDDLVRTARAAVEAGAAGLIATNTTRARPPGLEKAMEGGLSGGPLRERARQAIAALHRGLGRDVPVVGVGGIGTGEDALGHVLAGATLLQAYTGFVYRGPRFPARVHAEMLAELDRLGLDRLEEAVGRGDLRPTRAAAPAP